MSEEINSNSEDVLTRNKDDEMTGACIQNSLDLDHDSEPSGTTNNVEITNSKGNSFNNYCFVFLVYFIYVFFVYLCVSVVM